MAKKQSFVHVVQICKESGECTYSYAFQSDSILNDKAAQSKFDHIEECFQHYKQKHGLKAARLSEWDCSGTVGYLKLIRDFGGRKIKSRELYLKA